MTEPHDHPHHHHHHESGHDHASGGETGCADDHTAATGQDPDCGAGHCHDDHDPTAP
ncbi:hypothetical protein ABZ815_11000 [Nonomuraea sp. NPDC047529]|uniref:hypothetical protein n=1 Tax=Nonomuraea sp. NPDC047529 TaxID=3155623 RepID=UPI0033C54D12